MIFTDKHDLDRVQINYFAKYLGQGAHFIASFPGCQKP